MRVSLSLPLSCLHVQYLVETHALAYAQKGAVPDWIVEDAEQVQPRARTGAGSAIHGGVG